MKKRNKMSFGVLLIGLGLLLLAGQIFPELEALLNWPYWGIVLGAFIVVLSAIQRDGGWTIAGAILAGVGVNVLLQPQIGGMVWFSMLAFLGLGLVISSWFDANHYGDWRDGLTLILIWAVIFMLTIGRELLPLNGPVNYWPILLIGLGVWVLISDRRKQRKE